MENTKNEFNKYFEVLNIDSKKDKIKYFFDVDFQKWDKIDILDNKTFDVNKYIFSYFYRFNQFEMMPLNDVDENFEFHPKDFWHKSGAVFNKDERLIHLEWMVTWDEFLNPRIKRDVILAWSIRKDFYKYWIKTELNDLYEIVKKTKFLEEALPLEENIVFAFEDGFYICNPISDENLIKIKDCFKEENVFINDHELYFDLDKNTFTHTGLIDVTFTKFGLFTYFFLYIDFNQKKILKVLHKNGYWLGSPTPPHFISNFKDWNFFTKLAPEETDWIRFGKPFNWKVYQDYIESEWRRIPEWYKPYMKPEMLEIKRLHPAESFRTKNHKKIEI